MKKVRGLKSILASVLVTAALATPAVMLSSETPEVKAELHFSGVKLEMLSDGTVQAIFEVSVDKIINCVGASFILDYNPDYFTPSYMVETTDAGGVTHSQNEAYVSTTPSDDDGFFTYDTTLYKKDVSPFMKMRAVAGSDEDKHYSVVTTNNHTISMDLWLDQDKIKNAGGTVGKLKELKDVAMMDNTLDSVYVINRKDDSLKEDKNVVPQRVILGSLSFQVVPERLDEIARYFPKPKDGSSVTATETAVVTMDSGADTYLIRTTDASDSWTISHYKSNHPDTDPMFNQQYTPTDKDEAKRYYEMAVDPKQLMTVRPAEEAVTINAYQAYTNGTWDDVAQALRRYSPMATITYVDGTQENVVIPWGDEGEEAEYTVRVKGTDDKVDLTDNSTYNPLEGVYEVTQYVPGKNRHPIAITVTLTVTPIKLVNVEVENQVITYDLGDVVSTVKSPGDLHLPDKARLITDIVPSGVSMVMNIPGWRPEKGAWPVLAGDNSNARTLMNDLKEDSYGAAAVPPGEEATFNPATMPYWPSNNDTDTNAISKNDYYRFLKQKNGHWIGEYTFHIADKPGGTVKAVEVTGENGPETIEGFTREEIQEVFPWLTVEKEGYAVPTALRQIVPAEKRTDANAYKATYVSTTIADNGQPELTLSVRRGDGTALKTGSIFRVWLPNGLELGTGTNIAAWPDDIGEVKMPQGNWFPKDANNKQNGTYHADQINEAANNRFHLVTNSGDPTTGGEETFPDNRETLRRYINLGGWYQVAVCEEPGSRTWSDPMLVYVPPRPNEYLADKVYNFVGENTELFHWPGGLTHYVTMPMGKYTAVTADGVRLYDLEETGEVLTLAEIQAKAKEQADNKDTTSKPQYANYLDNGRPKTTLKRHEESYGYHTTYDGSTGAQPGTLYSFQVNSAPAKDPKSKPGDPWDYNVETFKTAAAATPPDAAIWRYGPDPFYDGAIYPSYGTVTQPVDTRPVGDQPAAAQPYKVTVRRDEVEEKKGEREHITLTSDSPTGITRKDPNDLGSKVTLATYDTRTERYTDRQEYTFIITNDGDVPIYGLAIDGLTDGYVDDTTGGRFEMVQAPASFLAPGQSTTFVLTYVYNLGANGKWDQEVGVFNPSVYRDTLYITSSSHPNGGKNNTNQDEPGEDGSYDYLLDFDAEFKVTELDTHIVNVVVKPGDYSMGSAGLIVGAQQANATDYTMNYTVTTRSYAAGDHVFVAVYMKDEYEIKTYPPICLNALGDPVSIVEIKNKKTEDDDEDYEDNNPWGIVLQPGIRIFYIDKMPDYDVTVTIEFFEDYFSKLRLSDLVDFSAPTEEQLKPTTTPQKGDSTYFDVWRKSYTDEERKDAKKWHQEMSQNPEEDLYLATVGTTVKGEDGMKFIDTENQYIVVIPYDAKWSQVQIKLRALETYSDYTGVYNDPNNPEYESDGSLKEFNKDIPISVEMYKYEWGFAQEWTKDTNVPDKMLDVDPKGGSTKGPTEHVSQIFKSPEPGTSDYVRITANYGTVEKRSYYLEIHRAPENPIATLNYGNSPYGMIMNDSWFHSTDTALTPTEQEQQTKENQDLAKAAFRNNGYTFDGLANASVPQVVRLPVGPTGEPAVSQTAVYWREAWVHNTKLFEPESLTGFIIDYPDPTPTPDPSGSPAPSDPDTPDDTTQPTNQRVPVIYPDSQVYRDEENLDLNDYAYFAILGENLMEPGVAEALDSTGRPVKLQDIRVRAKVTLLDNDATTQIGRFSGTETATLDLGTLDDKGRGKILRWIPEPAQVNGAQAGRWNVSSETTVDPETEKVTTTYTQVEHIRPGQYVLEYVYDDYNGKPLSVTRPFVILSSVGDVNCDGGTVSTADETTLKKRVTDPLGYVAGRWEWVLEETSPGEWEWKWKETVYPRANIFKYRVVDVNNDRNVNNIDGNLINKIARKKAQAIRFYNPVYYIYSAPGT